MRILILTQFFAPDITAAAFRMTDFARLLSERGHDVRVITSHPHKVRSLARGPTLDAADRPEWGSDCGVLRCHIREVTGSGAKAYIRHYLSFVAGSVRLGTRLWLSGWRPDIIYVTSPPLFVGLAGRYLSLLYRRPVVFEVRDIWPDTAVAAGQLAADGRAYRIGRAMEKYFYRKASRLTCVSRPMAEYLANECETEVTVVYNGIPVPSDLPAASSPSETRPAATCPSPTGVDPAKNRRTLLYAGNLGHLQELDLVIEAFARLRDAGQMTDWQIHFVGDGACRERLQSLVNRVELSDRVHFIDAVPREEALRRMSTAELLYLHLKQDETLTKTIPSKVFDYLLAGRPIVGGILGEGREILEKTGANVTFEPGNVGDMVVKLRYAAEHLDWLSRQAGANRELVLRDFTRERAVLCLEEVFRRATGQSEAGCGELAVDPPATGGEIP